MKKISKTELLAILTAAGVSAGSMAMAADKSSESALGKVEHGQTNLGTEESKCGKGSCGKDEKGAAAAKEKKEGKAKKEKKEKKAEGDKKDGEKSCKKDGEKSCKKGD